MTSIQPVQARRGRDNSADDANIAGLVRPFKVRFKRESNGAQGLADYSNNIVLVEPFATLSAIEDFLYPRVNKPAVAPRRSSRLYPPAGVQHDDEDDDEDDEDDDEDDEDEHMSDDDDDEVFGDDGEGDGRDLDLTNEDISPEDALDEYEDDHVSRSDSFAARAAAANDTRKLVFSVNGVVLNSSTTVLQAVAAIARYEWVPMS